MGNQPGGIPVEALKAYLSTSTNMLYEIIKKIWDAEEIPEVWKEGYLSKLPKEVDLRECKNNRGIKLLSVPMKMLNRIIPERLKMALDYRLSSRKILHPPESNTSHYNPVVYKMELSCLH